MADPFTTHAHTHTHTHTHTLSYKDTDFILKIHWPNPITHSDRDTCAYIHTLRLFTTNQIHTHTHTHSALIENPQLLELTEQMVILLGDDETELCVYVRACVCVSVSESL